MLVPRSTEVAVLLVEVYRHVLDPLSQPNRRNDPAWTGTHDDYANRSAFIDGVFFVMECFVHYPRTEILRGPFRIHVVSSSIEGTLRVVLVLFSDLRDFVRVTAPLAPFMEQLPPTAFGTSNLGGTKLIELSCGKFMKWNLHSKITYTSGWISKI